MKYKLLIIFLLLISIVGATHTKTYYWEDITTHLYLNKDGTANVVEIQEFNFHGSFTYAYRYFHFDEIDEIRNIKVYENNKEITNKQIFNENGMRVVKWFFNAKDEKRKFTLEYTVDGLVDFRLNKDKIFWTAVFKDHEKEVKSAALYLHFPEKINPNEISFRTKPEANFFIIDSSLK